MVKFSRKISSVCHVMAVLVIFGTACQQVEQGYWTKTGMSQSQFNAEYRRDFRKCAQQGLQEGPMNDGAPESDTIRARHLSAAKTGTNAFNDCMHAYGYEWIKMQPLVGPNAHGSTVYNIGCREDRVIVDPYGYPHCTSPNQIQPARSIDVPREASLPMRVPEPTHPSALVLPEKNSRERIPEPSPRKPLETSPDIRTTDAARETAQRRAFDESLCIQHSQASLSNPYETFLRCMEEKGWSSGTR
jgi:hypothetical protein